MGEYESRKEEEKKAREDAIKQAAGAWRKWFGEDLKHKLFHYQILGKPHKTNALELLGNVYDIGFENGKRRL